MKIGDFVCRRLVDLDIACRYVPVVSTLSAIVTACLKNLAVDAQNYQNNPYFFHLHNVRNWQIIAYGSIPVVSTLTFIVLDLEIKCRKKSHLLKFIEAGRCHYYLMDARWSVLNDAVFMEQAVSLDRDSLLYLGFDLIHNKKFFLNLIEKHEAFALHYASHALRDDPEVVKAAVALNGNVLCYASKRLQDDKEIVLLAVNSAALSYRFLEENMKKDPEVLQATIVQIVKELKAFRNIKATQLRSELKRFLKDVDYLDCFKALDKAILYHPEVMRAFLEIDMWSVKTFIKYFIEIYDPSKSLVPIQQELEGLLSDTNSKNRTLALKLVKISGLALAFVSSDLKNDEEVVSAACQQNPEASVFAGKKFRDPAFIFSLMVFLCDDFFKLKSETALGSQEERARFFEISRKLPMELQKVLANRVVQSAKILIRQLFVDSALKSIAYAN